MHPDFRQKCREAFLGFRFKKPAKGVWTDMSNFCNILQRNFLLKIIKNVLVYIVHPVGFAIILKYDGPGNSGQDGLSIFRIASRLQNLK